MRVPSLSWQTTVIFHRMAFSFVVPALAVRVSLAKSGAQCDNRSAICTEDYVRSLTLRCNITQQFASFSFLSC
eukprot:COSAG06_NODE_1027_length_11028_cov_3.385031_3_plen_73_part_00